MKKLLKIVIVLAILVAAVLTGAVFYADRYLQTPEFKAQVTAAARDAVGSDVKIGNLKASVFSGVTLKQVVIANPPGFAGNLLTADEFVLRYDLLPLLQKRVQVDRLSLGKPVLTLCKNDKGDWNYEKFGAQAAAPAAKPPAAPAASKPAATPSSSTSAAALDVRLSKLALADAEVVVLGAGGKLMTKLEKVDASTSLDMAGGKTTGSGNASVATLNAANFLFGRGITAPVAVSAEAVKLAPLRGKLAGGDVSGAVALKLAGGFKYVVNIAVKDGSMETLLKEAGQKPLMTGKLQATSELEGTGGLPTINGKGQLAVSDGLLVQLPLQSVLATLLQVAALKEIKFQTCTVDYALANNILKTPSIKLLGPQVQITGSGEMSLADYTLKHELTLALAKDLLGSVPSQLQSALKAREDGFMTLTFKVTGPYDSPKTDLLGGVLKNVIQDQLKRLFR